MSNSTQGQLHVGGDGTIIYDTDGWGVANATVFHGRKEPGTAAANARRLAACWNACEGITTEVLGSGSVNNLDLQRDRMVLTQQRDELLAALVAASDVLDNVQGDINPERGYADDLEGDVSSAFGTARAAIAKAKGPQWKTGTAGEGASNFLLTYAALAAYGPIMSPELARRIRDERQQRKGEQPAPVRYTHPSKGGSYEKLGVIRGAGSLKGLAGIAYRNEAGDLFVREPESFAARMSVIKDDGGAE